MNDETRADTQAVLGANMAVAKFKLSAAGMNYILNKWAAKNQPIPHEIVAVAFLECPRCKSIISFAEVESMRLFDEGASEQVVQDAAHLPRFVALADHRLWASGL